MTKYLIKPRKDRDFYVEWDTGIDQAISWGTRENYVDWGYSDDRLVRCDERGTSAYWFLVDRENPEDGEIWAQAGWLRYADMEEFLSELEKFYPGDMEIPQDHLQQHPELSRFLDLLE